MRCQLCGPLTVAVLRDNNYYHQPDLLSLKRSAESGCSLCTLFWTCLARTCDSDAIESHLQGRVYGPEDGLAGQPELNSAHFTDTAIRLRGELHDLGERYPCLSSPGDVMKSGWMSAGLHQYLGE